MTQRRDLFYSPPERAARATARYGREGIMARALRVFAAILAMIAYVSPAIAQKPGGILKIHLIDSPASMSIHEEATVVAERPVMAVFNNLVFFDQHVPQNSMSSIRPELATSWSWRQMA
jgi:peptide/nickel transport system substrate-binding protein